MKKNSHQISEDEIAACKETVGLQIEAGTFQI